MFVINHLFLNILLLKIYFQLKRIYFQFLKIRIIDPFIINHFIINHFIINQIIIIYKLFKEQLTIIKKIFKNIKIRIISSV
jgi:hypothetical protein